MSPVVGRDRRGGVRRVLEHVVLRIRLAVDDRLNLAADRDHRVTEPIELAERLALRRFDHQRARDRKGNRRRVESVIHQPLGDVGLVDAAPLLQGTQVENHFVRDTAVRTRVEHRIVFLEPRLDVVGVQDGVTGGVRHAFRAEHSHVGVGNQQDARAAPWRRRERMNRPGPTGPHYRMPGQVRREMRGHANGPHAGTAAAVRDAERLVQVQVADVGADRRRTRQPDLRVHVGAVHVHLSAVVMDDGADVLNALLENPVGGRIGDHQRREPTVVLCGFRAQILDVDASLFRAGHDHHAHPGHHRARRIRAVRRGGNQHHVAVALAAIEVVRADHHQAGELSLRPGIRLQRHGREAGDLAERPFDLAEHVLIPSRLIERHERVRPRKGRPRDRQHLGGGVELHRARSERNHRRVETDVLALEASDVAHHLRLGMMRVEHRMREERGRARQSGGIVDVEALEGSVDRHVAAAAGLRKHRYDRLHVVQIRRLVDRDVDGSLVSIAEIHARTDRLVAKAGRVYPVDSQRIEERRVLLLDPDFGQLALEEPRRCAHATRDGRQTSWSVVHSVETRHVRQQRLCRADI